MSFELNYEARDDERLRNINTWGLPENKFDHNLQSRSYSENRLK